MTPWYFHSGSGDRVGPFEESAAQQYAQQHPTHFCWREGFTGWLAGAMKAYAARMA